MVSVVRSQRSCETQLVQFFHDMVGNLDRALNRGHRQTDVIIMDFAKAFDNVPHKRLLHKLQYYGIRGSTHKWIASWLSERYQKVVLDYQASDPVPVLSGSVLGPILFLIFINDLPDNIRSPVRLFADDCVLYSNINSLTDSQILQEDLNSLIQWETDWQMKFNVAKFHSMMVPGTSLAMIIKYNTVSLDKDRYLTPAPNLRSTRASHDSQYTIYMAYSDALKNSFFPRTIPLWNCLPSSLVSSKTAEKFKALI